MDQASVDRRPAPRRAPAGPAAGRAGRHHRGGRPLRRGRRSRPARQPGRRRAAARPRRRRAASRLGDDSSFTREQAGRHLIGQRRDLGGGHYGWFLRDRTEEVRRTDALEAERGPRRRSWPRPAAGCRPACTWAAACGPRPSWRSPRLADAAADRAARRAAGSARWLRLTARRPARGGHAARAPASPRCRAWPRRSAASRRCPSRWLDAGQAPGWLLPDRVRPGRRAAGHPAARQRRAGRRAGARPPRRRRPPFSAEDEMLARIFAARAGAAISAAALYREQVDTAAVLQADLLPPELPQPGRHRARRVATRRPATCSGSAATSTTCSARPPASPDTVIVLGDVCGNGPEAAVLTGKVRQTLRALRLVETRPANMLRVLNQALLQAGRQHRFVTMVVGSVTPGRARAGPPRRWPPAATRRRWCCGSTAGSRRRRSAAP